MEVSEIQTLKSQLEKSISNGKVNNVLDLLERLENFKATESNLRLTKIGLCLSSIKKHKNTTTEINTKVKLLVDKWKKTVRESSSNNSSTSSEKHTSIENNASINNKKTTEKPSLPNCNVRKLSNDSNNNAISPASSSVNSPNPSNVKERTFQTDGIKLTSTGSTVRDNCTGMLYSALGLGSEEESDLLLEIAISIEKTVFGKNEKVDQQYKSKIRSLFMNLKDKSNPELKERVISGELAVEVFTEMKPEEMASDQMKILLEKAKQQSLHFAQTPKDNSAETDQFKCGRCGKRRTKYYQMQTRSADEPMTTFVTCLACNNRWSKKYEKSIF
ncbi:RNA polymerase II elongation factor [Clydaea vesicula]|uniref:Transcription elongation factor n=1 Tax=Clydaea vesicula TaxID=447962 RepID=A0AAD5U0A4_9FUNG|nr:RNA polymerase II elongation factor [Clydaea vesicula]